jgi:lipopolysaccharide transport system permease protein
MTEPTPTPPTSPAAHERVIRPRTGLIGFDLGELWRYRELFWFLTWRDLLVRYKQTSIGIAWAALQPLLMMGVLTLVFERLGNFPSNGAPYAVLTFAALLPWQFFANALGESSTSLIASQNMITKVYFPRLVIPASAVLSGVLDFLIALGLLLGLMLWYDVPFTARLLLLPVFFAVVFLAAFAAGLWFSALSVKYRDVKYVVPFLVRLGLYACPVAYLSSVIPPKWALWYNLNPLVGAIDGFRWCILGPRFAPDWNGFLAGTCVILVLLVTGALHFRNTEKTFADLI